VARHVPVRTCIVCREPGSKRDLTRLVRTTDGVVVDPTGKLNGRGAYLCAKPECWSKAASSSILEAALKVQLTETDRNHLLQQRPNHA
jgi:hypothetical protein